MNIRVFIPLFVFALVLAGPAVTPRTPSCPTTYCVYLTSEISFGSSGSRLQPVLSVVSILQLVGVAVALSPSIVALASVRKVAPLRVLQSVNHLRQLGGVSNQGEGQVDTTYWLPIESVSAGRITSKMTRGEAFFGPGRR